MIASRIKPAGSRTLRRSVGAGWASLLAIWSSFSARRLSLRSVSWFDSAPASPITRIGLLEPFQTESRQGDRSSIRAYWS